MRRVGNGELFRRSPMSRFWRASMSKAADFVGCSNAGIVERTFDGSVDVDEWPRSGRALAFPGSPTVIPCCENNVITQDVLGQTLWKMGRLNNCDIRVTWLAINTVL
jgi:hypothetical protein